VRSFDKLRMTDATTSEHPFDKLRMTDATTSEQLFDRLRMTKWGAASRF
jgi:hypothetical protein